MPSASPPDEFEETRTILSCRDERARQQLLAEVFERHHEQLRRMVRLRLHGALQGRVGTSDVLQEAFLEASRRLEEFLKAPDVPVFIWLRFLASQKIVDLHRYHLEAKRRDLRREVRIHQGATPQATSQSLAIQLLAPGTSPSEAAIRAEQVRRLEEALEAMDPLDREVVALRHFEELTSAETARVLGIEERAASKRYLRALERLRGLLKGASPGSARASGNEGG